VPESRAPYLFQTVAAVVIGGTALIGGRGGSPARLPARSF
jgi:ribose/xylose/arabinose/galactoside ABC-type transport system permease subunit